MRFFFLFISGFLIGQLKAQTINTVAGNGAAGFGGDSIAATASSLNQPFGVATDSLGNLYIADRVNNRIRKVDTAGMITTIAGNGAGGYAGDGGAATAAFIFNITGVAADNKGNIYIADKSNNRIRKVDAAGIITTIAGTGVGGYNSDGISATTALLNNPRSVTVDTKGNIFIADQANDRVRKIDTSGIITTIAGNGTPGFSGDGGQATMAQFRNPYSVAIDGSGNIYVSDVDNERIRKIDTAGMISTIAGNGTAGYSGDGAAATAATLSEPIGIAVDAYGTVYIGDGGNNRLRAVNNAGIIYTIAGTGTPGFTGDGGHPIMADLYNPYGITVSSAGIIYIADNGNNRIRSMHTPTFVRSPVLLKEVTVYPNPNRGSFTINVSSPLPLMLQLMIANTSGQVVYQSQGLINSTINLVLPVPEGIYFLKMICGTETWIGSIEVVK